jgi:adenylate cyclase
MAEVLDRHAGLLDKFVGDEIIGLFGAPIEMEDAPLKAVMCALDMLRSLREFNRTRQAEAQPPILIGIGINTGTVITGAIGADRNLLNYTAIGDAMNVASRLVSIARPNEIIISEATFHQVRPHVEAAPLPPVMVKGKTEEQRIFRVLGLRGNRDWLTDPTHS